MALDRHVTLRCLLDDLLDGWEETGQQRAIREIGLVAEKHQQGSAKDSDVARHLRNLPPFNVLAHPLIRSFNSSFHPDSDSRLRESISGMSEPHWWKQKTGRWRGAATDHAMVGNDQVWLCAGGKRAAGDDRDFYTQFTRAASTPKLQEYLPSPADRLIETVDLKITKLDTWKHQVACATLALLGQSLHSIIDLEPIAVHAVTRGSDETAIGTIALAIDRVLVDDTEIIEVVLTARPSNPRHIVQFDVAVQIARATLQPNAEDWQSTAAAEDVYIFSAMLDEDARSRAALLATDGDLALSSETNLRLGVKAHYTRASGLVHAQVSGSSVRALCGYWFIPTADHRGRETCDECVHQHTSLPAS